MAFVASAIGVGAVTGLIGASMQADAASSASERQFQATQQAQNQQLEMFKTLNEQQAPYREAGYGALTNIQSMLPEFNKPFTKEDLYSNLAPNYEFMKQQGLGATGQNINVGGGGSNVDLAKTIFAENYAGNAYQNAFNNYQTQQSNIFNRLASIAGLGQAAQGQSQQLGQNVASNVGQLGIGGATALGAGQVGAANAWAGGLGNVGDSATLAAFLNRSNAANNSNNLGTIPRNSASFQTDLNTMVPQSIQTA